VREPEAKAKAEFLARVTSTNLATILGLRNVVAYRGAKVRRRAVRTASSRRELRDTRDRKEFNVRV